MSEVRFIRKNGRIIPIRTKKKDGKAPTASLAKAGVGTMLAADALGSGVGIAGAVKSLKEKAPVSKFAASYAKYIPKSFSVEAGSLDGAVLSSKAARNAGLGQRSFISVSGLRNEGVFAHELGHAIKSRQKGSANYKLRKQAVLALRSGRTTPTLASRLARPFSVLPAEWEASKTGFKILKEKYGVRGAVKRSGLMAIGQASYLGRAAGVALLGAAGASFLYNTVRGK